MIDFIRNYQSSLDAAMATVSHEKVALAIEWLREARDSGRSIFVAGNGGSAATASHLVCDMVKGASYGKDRRFRMMALHDNLPTLTAYSNDVDYTVAAVEQLKNFAQPGDVLLTISGSGNSPNVVKAAEWARAAGLKTIALTGRDGGRLGPASELEIRVAEPHMGRIEDAHMIICHMICYYFMDMERGSGCAG
ncbi:MAG: SIS domain-containing protein [Bryobacteraceae bacterium]|nr:SIS domain-containing protein [Bryobacteraceae bacterium]